MISPRRFISLPLLSILSMASILSVPLGAVDIWSFLRVSDTTGVCSQDINFTGTVTFSGGVTSDAELNALAGLTSGAYKIPYFTGTGTATTVTASADIISLLGCVDYAAMYTALGISANGKSLINAADYAAMRALLDLEAGTDLIAVPAGSVQGDVLYHNGTSWTRLAAGTSGYYLQTQGAAANPQWASAATAGGGQKCFSFTLPTDGESDPLHFQIEIDNDMDFASPIVDWDTRATEEGVTGCAVFDGTNWIAYPGAGAGAAYYGERVNFVTSSASLLTGTLYYIRYRVHDGTSWTDYTGSTATW